MKKDKDKEPDNVDLWWSEQLKSELKKLDDDKNFPVRVPDLASMERLVIEQQRELRRTLIRDLLLFWLSAVLVLTVILSVAYHKPLLFAILQAPIVLAGMLAIFGGIVRGKKVDNR